MSPTRITTAIAHNMLFPRVNNGDEYGDRSHEDTKQGGIQDAQMTHTNLSKGGIIAIVRAT
jgi:hypothetical protein